jgi:hypothetical protein
VAAVRNELQKTYEMTYNRPSQVICRRLLSFISWQRYGDSPLAQEDDNGLHYAQGVPSPKLDCERKLTALLGELFVKSLAWVQHVEKAVIFLSDANHYRLRERMIILHTLY